MFSWGKDKQIQNVLTLWNYFFLGSQTVLILINKLNNSPQIESRMFGLLFC